MAGSVSPWLPDRLMGTDQRTLLGEALSEAVAKRVAARVAFDGSSGMPAAARLALRVELEKARAAEAAAQQAGVRAGWMAGKFHNAPDLDRAVQVPLAGLLADARCDGGGLAQVA